MEGFRHARMVDCTSGTVPTSQSGYKEYRVLSTDDKPTAGVIKGDLALEMDTNIIYYFDGTSWEVY